MVWSYQGPWISEGHTTFNGDSAVWHLLACRYRFADWLETQDPAQWKLNGPHHRARYWVREDLYTLCLLQKENKDLI